MNGRRIVIISIFVLLIGIVVISTPAWAQRDSSIFHQILQPTSRVPIETPSVDIIPDQKGLDSTDIQIIEKAAETFGLSTENLQVEYKEQVDLPLTGQSFTYSKIIDVSNGDGFDISLDARGSVVDGDALRAAEKDAYYTTFGKLHPSLANHLQSLSPDDLVQVSIWLDMGGRDASIARLVPEEATSMSTDESNQLRAQIQAQAALVHHEVEQPLLDLLPSLGGRVISAADTAPLVFTEIPVSAIPQLEALPYVVAIDLLVEGVLDEDEEIEITPVVEPELDIARPASKADIVQARGINGTGIIAAVIEDDSAAFANPYIDGICGPNPSCPCIQEHSTTVCGVLASTHSTYRGIAPGIGTGLRSGSGGTLLEDYQSATAWALGQSATVFNNSYSIEHTGDMEISDRWMDYIVRTFRVLEVKSAANRAAGGDARVTSPGLGYNVLTVGAIQDQNTITWDDDSMAEFSSYVQPVGRQKPEISAVGCGIWITGLVGQPGIISTGIDPTRWVYDKGCGTSYAAPIITGGGALLINRNPDLAIWPEAQKAILIATALHNIEGALAKSEIDGAGAVDLAAADTVAANGWWRALQLDKNSFDTNNYYTAMTIYLYAGERVRAALAYDSNPSADFTSDLLEGNLDLYLKDPSGTIVASGADVDSWQSIDYTTTADGLYTVLIENHGGSLSGSEWTYAGVAVWPGHYVLAPYVSQVRDRPLGAWNKDSGDDYRFTGGSSWGAIGIRESPSNYDLYLFNNSVYGDPADHIKLGDSTIGGGAVDFVLVDGNHAPSGNYYTTVSANTGTNNYNIQQAAWTDDVNEGTYGPYSMATSDVLRVWDTVLSGGIKKYFAIKPVSGDANLGMALFVSDPGNTASFYQGRTQAVVFADSAGGGVSESMSYQTAIGDELGLMVWNNGATTNTSYTLYADTTAPNGTIAINGGAPYVNSTSVTLNLSGVDTQTGVYQMQFSNDGISWSGWEAYSSSKAWTLTAGDGTKTVYVQYKNNAEISSDTISDTIILDTTPPSSNATSPAHSMNLNITVSWIGSDATSGVTAYDVQYRVGAGGTWKDWLTHTTATSAIFGPINPVKVAHSETYFFRVRAYDGAGNRDNYPGGDGDTSTYIDIGFLIYLPILLKQ